MEKRNTATALTPSNSMVVPLHTPPPPHFHHRPPFTAAAGSHFRLPSGWGIEEIPRLNSSHVDRYYFEPGTGKRFRSLRGVERHLNGEEYTTRSIYSLPDGWVVEEVPRRDGINVDRYYYEPGTGQKFRSRLAVERHLAEYGEHMPCSQALQVLKEHMPLSKTFKLHQKRVKILPTHQNYSVPSKRNISGEVKKSSSFIGPPSKIKWVLASPKGNAWNPFIAETSVPDPVKQQWNKRFTLFMNDDDAST